MQSEDIKIRQATLKDVDILTKLRRMMFESMGEKDLLKLDKCDSASKLYFEKAIPNKEFYGWLALLKSGEIVGSGGFVIDEHVPSPTNSSGRLAYILNIVTLPDYRRQGIARNIMKKMLEWISKTDMKVVELHASEMGKSLYKEFGFEEGTGMRLILK